MMNLDENSVAGYQNPGNNGYGGGSRTATKRKVKRDKQNRPLFPCPLPCLHENPHGRTQLFTNIINDANPLTKDKVKKYKICVKCLKKGSLNTLGLFEYTCTVQGSNRTPAPTVRPDLAGFTIEKVTLPTPGTRQAACSRRGIKKKMLIYVNNQEKDPHVKKNT